MTTNVFTAPDTQTYEIDDAMKSIDEKIKGFSGSETLAREAVKTANAIVYLTTRGWTCIAPGGIDIKKLSDVSRELVEAVEGYVCPKKGDKYVFRNEVLAKCNALKKLLNETE